MTSSSRCSNQRRLMTSSLTTRKTRTRRRARTTWWNRKTRTLSRRAWTSAPTVWTRRRPHCTWWACSRSNCRSASRNTRIGSSHFSRTTATVTSTRTSACRPQSRGVRLQLDSREAVRLPPKQRRMAVTSPASVWNNNTKTNMCSLLLKVRAASAMTWSTRKWSAFWRYPSPRMTRWK